MHGPAHVAVARGPEVGGVPAEVPGSRAGAQLLRLLWSLLVTLLLVLLLLMLLLVVEGLLVASGVLVVHAVSHGRGGGSLRAENAGGERENKS